MSKQQTKATQLQLVKEQSARYTNESELPFSSREREDDTPAGSVVEPATVTYKRAR